MKSKIFSIMHNVVAHPVVGLFPVATWAQRFHDWTARRAWGRL